MNCDFYRCQRYILDACKEKFGDRVGIDESHSVEIEKIAAYTKWEKGVLVLSIITYIKVPEVTLSNAAWASGVPAYKGW